jgi:hypothetical protein
MPSQSDSEEKNIGTQRRGMPSRADRLPLVKGNERKGTFDVSHSKIDHDCCLRVDATDVYINLYE